MSYLELAKKIQAELHEPVDDITDGRVRAVSTCSTVLKADIWLAFDGDFVADDGDAVFYSDELEMLKGKTTSLLQAVHRQKLCPGGARVRQ